MWQRKGRMHMANTYVQRLNGLNDDHDTENKLWIKFYIFYMYFITKSVYDLPVTVNSRYCCPYRKCNNILCLNKCFICSEKLLFFKLIDYITYRSTWYSSDIAISANPIDIYSTVILNTKSLSLKLNQCIVEPIWKPS